MTNVQETLIPGVFKLISEPFEDNRGSFLNLFRENEESFRNTWGSRNFKQINLSNTKNLGAIRGLHLQKKPYQEAKIVRCIKGKIFDVAVDLRKESVTFMKWVGIELSPSLHNAFMIPEGCAHGFQVIEEESSVLYFHSENWIKESDSGIRWNDPELNIKWPLPALNISQKDQNLPYLKNATFL